MQVIKCTAKLQKEMGLKKSDLTDKEPSISYLGPWHANLIHINRRKCVLFCNDKTLFNFIVPDVSRKLIRKLPDIFLSFLESVLADEGFSPAVQEKIQAEYSEINFAKTDSRKVLGSMNDQASCYEYLILKAGGVHSCQVPEIIKKLNRMPMGAINYKFPVDILRQLYASEK